MWVLSGMEVVVGGGGGGGGGGGIGQDQSRLNTAVQQQLNLDSVKTRAISLFNAISRILEDLDLITRRNSAPKWFVLFFLFLKNIKA